MPIPVYGTPISLTQNAPGDQYNGHLTASANGGFAAAWFYDGPAYLQLRVFKADGIASGLLQTLGQTKATPYSIDIATLANGTFVAACSGLTGPIGGPVEPGNVYGFLLAADGSLIGSAFIVNSSRTGLQLAPVIAAQSTGEFIIGFHDEYINKALRATRYDVSGQVISDSYYINDVETSSAFRGSVAVAADNTQLWVYIGNALKGYRHSADGFNYIGSEFIISDFDSAPVYFTNEFFNKTQTVFLSTGQYAVAWKDYQSELNIRIINADGSFGSNVIIAATGVSSTGGITALLDGGFIVGYDTNNGDDSFIRQFRSDGTAVDVAQALPVGAGIRDGGVDLITLADGRVVASYYEAVPGFGFELKAQLYDPRSSGISLYGTLDADDYVGSAFNDTIDGSAGSDTITGGGGNDLLQGNFSFDTISGGDGDDMIFAFTQAAPDLPDFFGAGDLLMGDAGNDTIRGGIGADTIIGGTGDDSLVGGAHNDSLSGGTGNDTFVYLSGLDTITDFAAGGTDDRLDISAIAPISDLAKAQALVWQTGANTTIALGYNNVITLRNVTASALTAVDFTLAAPAVNNPVNGTAGPDTLTGTAGVDSMTGGTGNDSLAGLAGDDTIMAGDGEDFLLGGANNDLLDGGNDNDVLLADTGDDTLIGGSGSDYLYSGTGNNVLSGGAGLDILVSEGTNDIMNGGADQNYYYRQSNGSSQSFGGEGVDIFVGGAFTSNDLFYGFGGDDFALGGAGSDSLVGGDGNDILIGENGNDTLDGGLGVNYLYADGTGSDLIRVNATSGGTQTQLLVSFEGGGATDSVNITGSTLTSFAEYQALAASLGTVIGGNILQNTNAGCVLTLNLGTGNQTDIWFLGTLAGGITSADLSFG
jgi:Ca2+-binding RTX toxin-like protein